MGAKQLLEAYGNKTREIEALQNKITEMRVLSERCTSMLHLAPGGNAYNDSRLEEFIARIDEMERCLGSLWEERGGIFIDIMNLLDAMPTEKYRRVLELRYLERKTFRDISATLYLCEKQVYRLHNKALEDAENVYVSTNKESL